MRGCLELQPLLHVVFFWEGGEGDEVLGVVLLDYVVHYCAGLGGGVSRGVEMGLAGCTYLGEKEVGVGVFDDGRHAVAV